jgi:subtilase family serine protease
VNRLRAIAAAGTASLLTVGGIAAATTASAGVTPPARQPITGSKPAWATAKALVNAKAPTTGNVSANIYLAGPDRAGLTAFAAAVSDPRSPQYGDYLTAAQVLARFAPTTAEAADVSHWATSNGLTVTKTTTGVGAYVAVSGTAAAVAHAFNITFGTYRLGGKQLRAPNEPATVANSIAGDVLAVSGLDQGPDFAKPDETLPPPDQNFFVAPTTSSFYGQFTATTVPGTGTKIPAVNGKAQPWTNAGYTPAQIRGAYNVTKSGETGKGVHVAVVDAYASPTMLADANQYAKATGDPGFRKGQYRQIPLGGTNGWTNTAACVAPGWYGEESLDVEAVHGMAPNANVTYVGAVSCTDADLANALAYIVNHHTASIVTNSWGETTDSNTIQDVYNVILQAGAAEGIGFFFSSGDSGYEDPNYQDGGSDAVQDDFPDSSPWATSVGGTSLAIGRKNNYEFETEWGTVVDPLVVPTTGATSWTFTPPATPDNIANFYDGSGGGGTSAVYPQPAYQKGVVPAHLATTEVVTTPPAAKGDPFTESLKTVATPMRVTPDVSALADPSTGFLVGQTLFGTNPNGPEHFFLSRIGGTSVAAPIFAGIEADAQQALGHSIGFANPLIYSLDRANAATHAFRDVVHHQGVFEVRDNFQHSFDPTTPLVTFLRLVGVNGTGDSTLVAAPGYDNATGVGSPNFYIQALKRR